MALNQGMFALKLYELNQHYGKLQSRIMLCQSGDQKKIKQEISRIKDECIENNLLLQSRIDSSRSWAVSKLARAQLDYENRAEEILANAYLEVGAREPLETGKKESAALYAEYAIDFATQAMRQALLASLQAIDFQLKEEEKQKEMEIKK